MKLFRVMKPGFFTTVQDLGRHGFLKYGIPISGAMDEFSFKLANKLVGNNLNNACLEATLMGPELEALSDTQIAVAGADLSPQINGQDVMMWRTLKIKNGDVVSFGRAQSGCRAYVSVRGGVDVPLVLGSRSTYVRCSMGGINGRQLRAGDIVEGYDSATFIDYELSAPQDLVPRFNREVHVSVVLGPQLESFTERAVATFLSNPYTVTTSSDRMGYRLDGPSLELQAQTDTISEAILPGAVQVPPSGKPIITMQDAQTTGGYAKIAAIITPDIPVVGQAKPEDAVRFRKITLLEASQRLADYRKRFQTIEDELQVRKGF